MEPLVILPIGALFGLVLGARRAVDRAPQVFEGLLFGLAGLLLALAFR